MPMNREMQIELYFRTRKIEGIDFHAVLNSVSETIKNGFKFADEDERISFLRNYAVIRDISLVAKHSDHLKKYDITTKDLSKCHEIVNSIEPVARHLGSKEFAAIYNHFAPQNQLDDAPPPPFKL